MILKYLYNAYKYDIYHFPMLTFAYPQANTRQNWQGKMHLGLNNNLLRLDNIRHITSKISNKRQPQIVQMTFQNKKKVNVFEDV